MTGVLALALGYLLGSVPWGLLLTRAAGLGDIRSIGSGNIGATNVLRTGNKALAAGTLALDILKGVAALALAASTYVWCASVLGLTLHRTLGPGRPDPRRTGQAAPLPLTQSRPNPPRREPHGKG